MKKRSLFRIIAMLFILSFFIKPSMAQLNDLGKIMAFQEDAQTLMKSYISPYTNSLGTDLSGGWYNTAKPHGVLGFDITFTLNTTFVPKSDQSFMPSELGLQTVEPADPSATSPTAMGDNTSGATMEYNIDNPAGGDQITLASFDLPKGTGISFAPAPMLQGAIGLPKGTELIGRYTPSMQLGSQAELGMWGVGVKHSIKQWIPALNKIPILQLSVLGGYTKLSSETNLNFQPEDYGSSVDYIDQSIPDDYYKDQQMTMDVSSFTGNLLVSANLPVVCFYGGVGFNTTTTELKLNGNYPVPTYNENEQRTEITESSSVTDPISMKIKHKDGNTTKPRYNAGIRFKFAVITLHFDYTYAEYSVFTTGLGLSIR
jgi:hypothetical protein